MLLVLPIQNSTSFFVDNEDVDCNWSCWGGNPSHTFSVSKECAPDLKNMKLLWKKNYKEQIGQHFFSNGYLYLISINNLRCIDAKNGELKWIKEDAEYRLVTIYKNNCLTISIKDGEGIMEFINILSCFDAASGELKWETVMSEDSCYSVPWLFTDGELVFTYNKSGVMASRNIPWLMNQYSLETGELIHSEKRDEHSIPGILFDNSLIISSVINYGYTIYAERILASYSINEHSINWETKAKGDGYSFVNVPILYSGYIYVLSSKGYQNNRTSAKLNCINPEDGSHIWDIEIPKGSWRLMSINSGMVIIADNEKMYCYDLLSKKEVWSVVNNETFFYIAISDDKLFCFNCPEKYGTEKNIMCYDLNNGDILWQEDCDDATVNQIVIADKKLFYSTKSGSYANGETNLYCWGVEEPVDCFSLSQDNIDIENIDRTSKITMSLVIRNNTSMEQDISIICNHEWLKVEPSSFLLENKQELIITVDGSKLTEEKKIFSEIILTSGSGCLEKRLPVNVFLAPVDMEMKLWISKPFIHVNGEKILIDVPPQIISGRTMVPIRVISEGMGAEVSWDGDERRIIITLTNLDGTKRVVKMWVNKTTAEIDGEQVELDSPPTILSGRTLVPVRFISEAFGASVNWNQEERAVTIVYTP